jgi:hypothetical protein
MHSFSFPSTVCNCSFSPTSLPPCSVFCFLDDSHSDSGEMRSQCTFDLHFIYVWGCWTFLHVFIGHLYFFGEPSFNSFAQLVYYLFFWCLIFWAFWIYSRHYSFDDNEQRNIGCLFILLIVFFDAQFFKICFNPIYWSYSESHCLCLYLQVFFLGFPVAVSKFRSYITQDERQGTMLQSSICGYLTFPTIFQTFVERLFSRFLFCFVLFFAPLSKIKWIQLCDFLSESSIPLVYMSVFFHNHAIFVAVDL